MTLKTPPIRIDGAKLLGQLRHLQARLDPGEAKEIKMTFRDVKRRFFDAKTAQVALETYH